MVESVTAQQHNSCVQNICSPYRFSEIVIHIEANDIHLQLFEVTKSTFVEVCKLARAMSDVVTCSGPILLWHGDAG